MEAMDRHKAALTIRAGMALRGRRQGEVAKAVGISRNDLNAFLNRRIDLLPEDIEKLVREIGLVGCLPVLSAPADKGAL